MNKASRNWVKTDKLFVSLPEYELEEKKSKELLFSSLPDHKALERKTQTNLHQLVNSRIDSSQAEVLQLQYGFPRRIVARTLLQRFEESGDDFLNFVEFYTACVEVAHSFGLQPPRACNRIVVPDKSRRLIQLLDEYGCLPGGITRFIGVQS